MATPIAAQLLDAQLILHLRASKFYMLASVVVLYFDYVLTFDLEVRNLWRKKWTIPSCLFLLNRYYPMLLYVVVLVAVHDPSFSGEICEKYKHFPLLSALASEAIIGIIVMLRLYALYGKSILIICLLAPLHFLQLLLGGWAADAVFQATGLPPGSGCIIGVPPEFSHRFAWLWGASAVFDTVVFGLTLYRVLTLRKTGLKVPLTTLFLRDGTTYFAVMFSARLFNFIIFLTAVTPELVTLNWTFNHTITVVMINRLVLNLRQQSSRDSLVVYEGSTPSHMQRILTSFVGDLGQSISTDTEDKDKDAYYMEEDFGQNIPRLHKDQFSLLEEGKE